MADLTIMEDDARDMRWWIRGPRRRRRELGRTATSVSLGRWHRPRTVDVSDRDVERVRLTDWATFARKVDIELRAACRMEASVRHELGIAARDLLRGRRYRRLGFVRLSDYARERLGVSARTLQAAAWVATRLDALPLVATAFDRSELSWTQARLICAAARPEDQSAWLARARTATVADLERIANASRTARVPRDPDDDDGTIDGEPVLRWRIACPARVRALWRRAVELASRAAGEPLAAWRAAEIIAAEAFSGRPAGATILERTLLTSLRLARRVRRAGGSVGERHLSDDIAGTPVSVASSSKDAVEAPAAETVSSGRLVGLGAMIAEPGASSCDPFALDARLVAAVKAIRTSEPRIGRLLRIFVDRRLYRAHGFTSVAAYVRERLGISTRKAWALLKVERATWRSDDFSQSYRDGTLSWVCALTLLPVIERANAEAWIARASDVTVRRLADEVNWVLEARDLGTVGVTLDPPPLDSVLVSGAARPAALAVQIGAHGSSQDAVTNFDTCRRAATEVCDVEIQCNAPVSVVMLVRETLDAYAEPGSPRWSALERVLQHVIAHFESTPRHRDPIFARDGWRCTVPGCSSRRNLHDHHLHYRSRGGDNGRGNRTTVCAAHHLHGIHAGTVRAWGTAPLDIHWHLGVRAGSSPLLAYVGDVRLRQLDGPRPG